MRFCNIPDLIEHLIRNGYNPHYPLIFAMDCDRTIVDRSQGAHFIDNAIVTMFDRLRADSRFLPVINTGRDITSYRPIASRLSHYSPCIFLAGRVINLSNNTLTMPEAILPHSFCAAIWKLFLKGDIPFIDTKSKLGNVFLAKPDRSTSNYYGLYRPFDWFDTVDINEQIVSEDESLQEHFLYSMEIVRMEIPLLPGQHDFLLQAICNQVDNLHTLFFEFLNIPFDENIQVIPISTHASRKFEKHKEPIFLRIMINNNQANKGYGLKYLLTMLGIPPENVICVGDSNGSTASDGVIKTILPQATLLITKDGDIHAQKLANFIIEGPGENGVVKAFDMLLQAIDHLKKAK